MKIEQQVVSLELAKKLKELGVKHDALFSWYVFHATGEATLVKNGGNNQGSDTGKSIMYHAFTVAELGEMLPIRYGSHSRGMRKGKDWICADYSVHRVYEESGKSDTEADARAKMLIYLLENKLI